MEHKTEQLEIWGSAARNAARAAARAAVLAKNQPFDIPGWFGDWVDGDWDRKGESSLVSEPMREWIREAVNESEDTRAYLLDEWSYEFKREHELLTDRLRCANCLHQTTSIDSRGYGSCCSFPS